MCKGAYVCAVVVAGMATVMTASGCKPTTPLGTQVNRIGRQLNLIQTPVSSRQMAGSIGSGRPNTPPAFALRMRGASPLAQARFARRQQSIVSPSTLPEVAASLRLVQADPKIAAKLGQKIALSGKFSYRNETFKDGTTETEFTYGVVGNKGRATIKGQKISKNGKATLDSLIVYPDGGGTLVLK